MDFEDFVEPEVGITAAVVAVVASPQVRRVVRRGAVLSLAGLLTAGDAITSFARGVSQGAQSAMSQSANGAAREKPSGESAASSTVDAADVTEEPAQQ
jgi:hypothetical protein